MSNGDRLEEKTDSHGKVTLKETLEELRTHWKALLAATLGTGFGVATLVFYTTGLFVPELKEEYGWSLSQLSLLPLIGALILILTAPFIGAMVDKVGVRIPPALSLIILGISFFALTITGPSFITFVIVWTLMYLLASASSPIAFTRIVTTRFDKARGLALGITLGGAGIVAFLVPKVLGTLIAENWRAGYYTLSVAVFVAAILFYFLLPKHENNKEKLIVQEESLSEEDKVVKPVIVAQLALIFLLIPLAVGGMTLHLVAMLRDGGLTAGEAANVASLVGISVVVGRMGVGLLIDRIFAPYVATGLMLISAAGFGIVLIFGPEYGAFAAVGLGLALGAEVDLIGYLTGRYFGIKRYGKFFGIFYAVFNVGLGLAPYLIAKIYDTTGSYSTPLMLAIGLLIVAAIVLLTLPKFSVTDTKIHEDTMEPARKLSSVK